MGLNVLGYLTLTKKQEFSVCHCSLCPLSVVQKSLSIQSTSYLAGLLLRVQGGAVSYLEQLDHAKFNVTELRACCCSHSKVHIVSTEVNHKMCM